MNRKKIIDWITYLANMLVALPIFGYGKLSFLFIKPGSMCSMKVNLLDRFLIKNHQSYSLELKGFIYLDNGKGLEFIIPQLNFFVE